MAIKNKTITNPATGQTFRFLQTARDTNGALLEIESTWRNQTPEPITHYHPYQDEDFVVTSGELHVRLNNTVRILHAGDVLHIPRGTVHAMWNAADTPARANWQVRPALDTEQLFETTTGLAADGKTDANGMPPFLQSAVTINRFHRVFRLGRPPYVLQKIIFTLVSPVAYLCGYRPTYAKYID